MPRPLETLTYTVSEAAEVLNVSPRSIRRLIAEGELPIVSGMGRRVLISKALLAEWVVEQSAPRRLLGPSDD